MELILKENLKKLLDSNHLTVTKLAEETQVNAQTIHNWLSGQKPRNIVHVKQVASYFGLSVDSICFDEEAKKSIEDFNKEISAGVFEVILRKCK